MAPIDITLRPVVALLRSARRPNRLLVITPCVMFLPSTTAEDFHYTVTLFILLILPYRGCIRSDMNAHKEFKQLIESTVMTKEALDAT